MRLHPTQALGIKGVHTLGVQSQPDGQIRVLALLGELIQSMLHFVQQRLSLLLLARGVLAFLLRAILLGGDGTLNAMVDVGFPGTQAIVLFLLAAGVLESGLELGAQLLDLRYESRDRVARRIPIDACWEARGRDRYPRGTG